MPRYISASGEAVQLARLQIARDSFQIAQYGSDVWPREIGRIADVTVRSDDHLQLG
ncbi:msr0959 [Mesorhizobium japonicum MAFF 303099]|uniref:Msr0959 protein n=1 Tax=Mesorhizobium japonicum (strain LMG 29417 / CECT 9101 / MAFF 303099) TaxID=266835 RepID=Q98LN0_RHILO|nr:msr0959 [Mesorhizobium japonicum MAFF 303099]